MDRSVKICAVSFIVLAFLTMTESLCPNECSCIYQPTSCPLGVRLAKDGCNCCNVCTRQYGEYCDEQNICDSEMGLVCDFGAAPGTRGICKVQIARSCSYNGRTYLNGEMFHPTCKHRCWCVDGAVGCLSTCPHETRAPLATECSNARLKSIEGECCQRWVCGNEDEEIVLPLDQFWNKYVDKEYDDDASEATTPEESAPTSRWVSRSRHPITTSLLTESKENFPQYYDGDDDDVADDDDSFGDYDEMTPVFLQKGGLAGMGLPSQPEYENVIENVIEDDDYARRRRPDSEKSCAVQTTNWSPCSKTCGLGIATRVTNNNRECELRRESRLCKIRPCDDENYTTPKRGRRCLRHRRERKKSYIRYSNCKSIRSFKARYCGGCDDGRCCTPHSTRTVRIRFRCENGEDLAKNMMFIRTCRCHNNCLPLTANSFLVSRDLRDDMHRSSEA